MPLPYEEIRQQYRIALGRKEAEDRRAAQLRLESQESNKRLLEYLEAVLERSTVTGQLNPGALKLYLSRIEDPKAAFYGFLYDLCASQTVGLGRAPDGQWVFLSGTHKTFKGLVDAMVKLVSAWDVPGFSSDPLTRVEEHRLIEIIKGIVKPPSDTYGRNRRIVVEAALASQALPYEPDGLSVSDTMTLRAALGREVI